ncbi:Glycine--tRNA ligase beta subunit [Candidatus Annandia adelgestsuga]|uniref:Glycine--tRNA ligase beta subunit n=1 Tax=Candidatus Annandia adelgestsuga TaxID=1302411 RepID=A0A3Q9CLZ9_9ENTR|nr:glycine--tRNA ligase subunit beta [Candidatus Annandia adelgestsuga]AZP36334.1 Glycine--tRNA ligase beta subunit [Candidatus Annandia adelgestsuga]
MKDTFLVEIGTEELPAKILKKIAKNFYLNICKYLNKNNISYKKIIWFATSRRIAVKIININKNNLNIKKKKKIDKINNKNYNKLYIKKKYIKKILLNIIKCSIEEINLPNKMRWGYGKNYFIRPIKNITIILGKDLINTKILNLKSNRIIYGSRFLKNNIIYIKNAYSYPNILFKKGNIIANYYLRKNKIISQIKKISNKIFGIVDLEKKLLEEVTSLIEFPIVLLSKFNINFLKIPNEIILYIIKYIQKCFPIYKKKNQLIPYFIFVSNIELKNKKKIIKKYEQIINNRFHDIIFFLNEDIKKKIINNFFKLKKILFYKNLGSLKDKTIRINHISLWISKIINTKLNLSKRSSFLSKCDLTTNIVKEFSNMQGIMGMYYSKKNNEHKNVSLSIKEQYQPKFFKDKIPFNLISCVLAIADKIDNIIGIIIINKKKKISSDPFALRRSILGIINIIIKNKINININHLIKKTFKIYNIKKEKIDIINKFIIKRIFYLYKKKNNTNFIKSILFNCNMKFYNLKNKIKIISYFRKLKIFNNLISINKRIYNIIKKSKFKINYYIKNVFFIFNEEIYLLNLIKKIKFQIKFAIYNNNINFILLSLINLCIPTNKFFNNIKIFNNNKKIINNRLNILNEILKLTSIVIDKSIIIN